MMSMQKGSETETARTLRKQVAGLSQEITEKAVIIVHEKMPRKILELQKLSQESDLFSLKRYNELAAVMKTELVKTTESLETARKRKRSDDDDGSQAVSADFPVNGAIVQLLQLLKREVLDLIEDLGTVKVWIQLNIPRIEDGNNFGVSIQEETVNELSRAEDAGFAVMESMTKYFFTRAKLISRVVKYPAVADYAQSVIELDEKEFINLKLCAVDLRNNYAILYDMIGKNLQRLEQPRPSNHMQQMF